MGRSRLWCAAIAVAAACVLTAPATAYAKPPPPSTVYGYVWANQPATAWYEASTGYEYNSTGGDIEITRAAAGDYEVRFAGMASGRASRGVAHAAAYGSSNNGYCTVAGYVSSGLDEVVGVRCFDANGALADMKFVANFTNAHAAGDISQLWADQPSAPAVYEPHAAYRYDSSGQVPTVERYAVGSYTVLSGAIDGAFPDHDDGHFQVTARSDSARHCEAHSGQDETPVPLPVLCRDADGTLVDTEFVFSYTRGVDLLAAGLTGGTARVRPHNITLDPYLEGWWNPGGEPLVTKLAVGRYQVRFPGLAASRGHAIAASGGSSAQNYCSVGSWAQSGADELVHVSCFDTVTNAAEDAIVSVSFVTGDR